MMHARTIHSFALLAALAVAAGVAHAQGASGDARSTAREAPPAGSTPGRTPPAESSPGRTRDDASTPGRSTDARSTPGTTGGETRSTTRERETDRRSRPTSN
jgi:hypothetical protein